MAGYLDQYGAGEEERERVIKWVVLSVVAVLAISGLVYVFFHNYPEEHQVGRFFQLLKGHDYQAAYALWGCTAPGAKPCRDYPFPEFMKDWGPQAAPVNTYEVLDGESCGSGVIVDVDAGNAGEKKLWSERDSHTLSFPPFDRCPQGNRIHDFWRNVRFRLHGRPIPSSGS
ncbi:MAG: hypothetical protein JO323_20445 [Acidobacteriia bacterium]|nr:hypothetical protein [Terriglobia bacterium]